MSRLLLHIGLPKTGSSAIQACLSDNAERLSGAGFCWLPGSRGDNQTELAVAFSGRDSIAQEDGVGSGRPGSDRDRERVRNRIRQKLITAARQGDVIISSEHLSGLLRSTDDIAGLAGFLDGIADRIVIIGVLRRADHWLPSAYAEAIRSGRTIKLRSGFVDRRAHLLDHDQLVRRWSAAFDDVRLIPFLESDKADPAALPKRFLTAGNVPSAVLDMLPPPGRLTRAGMSAEAVEVLRRINPQLDPGSWAPRDRERLVTLLAEQYPGPRVALTPAALRALDDHGWIQTGIDSRPEAYGAGWPGWRDAEPAPVAPPPDPSEAEINATLAAVQAARLGSGRPVIGRAGRILQRLTGSSQN